MGAVYNYQWDAATKIREDKTGRETQITGDAIEATNILDSWEEDQDTVMKCESLNNVGYSRGNSSLQTPKYWWKLREIRTYWGPDLLHAETAATPRENWPGKNKLGEMLMILRDHARATTPTPTPPETDNTNQQEMEYQAEAVQVTMQLIDKAAGECSHSSPKLLARADAIAQRDTSSQAKTPKHSSAMAKIRQKRALGSSKKGTSKKGHLSESPASKRKATSPAGTHDSQNNLIHPNNQLLSRKCLRKPRTKNMT